MNYNAEYKKWLENADEQTKKQLEKMSEEEIKEGFYRHLEFGTGGLRGIIGAGTNAMNTYVVNRATLGLAKYIIKKGEDFQKKGVVIAYDSRNFSKEFAQSASDVLTSNNIKAYLFDELRPTPELSFAVRHLNAAAGIVITASHNPAKYNGYKIYGEDGSQISPEVATEILSEINKIDVFSVITNPNKELLEIIGANVDEQYINSVYCQSINKDIVSKVSKNFKLIYTPLHGSGNKPVRAILKKIGFENVMIVKEQEFPDGNFPTVKSPNPEEKSCFTLAIELAKENNVNLIIGTDPDSDRMGIVLKNNESDYVTMSGNQVGILLTYYILNAKKENNTLPKNGAIISTIVSTKMTESITNYFGATFFKTLTGFKFIGEKIHEFEENNNYEFLFGFEESYGYLSGTYARDKDAVVASMLVAEMASYYYDKGMTLYDVMESLYKKFGYFQEELVSITLEGSKGAAQIEKIMADLRENPPKVIENTTVKKIIDYNKQNDTNLPKSNVLYFVLDNDVDFVIRPSGTEPKIKLYYLSKGNCISDAKEKINNAKKYMEKMIWNMKE